MTQNYIRKSVHSIEEIFSKILPLNTPNKETKIDIDGDLIRMTSHRYHLFYDKGCKCVTCGVEGVFFAKERDYATEVYHFNLYGIKDGEEVLMTKDHIIPRSQGGSNKLSNYQPMCSECNHKKGNSIEDTIECL